jgi:NAD-reducing hydrogenase large subunit
MGQKITIEPVTRVEGHGKVTIHLNGNGEVTDARLHINEFRGFEKFCEGRMFYEMPTITQRACGICPISHHLAASKACDMILGVQVPETGRKLRELLHMGQILQSHSLHFFHLASPDLLLGMDADPAKRNVFGLVGADPELALMAVRLRKFGQEVIKKVAGRRIHPYGSVPGGINDSLSSSEREEILGEVDSAIEGVMKGVTIIREFCQQNKELVDTFGAHDAGYMGLVNERGGLELYDGKLRLKDGQGNILVDQYDPADYLSIIGERVESWSYMKFPFYKPLGYPQGVYRVGPAGRLGVIDHIDTPLANEEFGRYRDMTNGGLSRGSLYYHYARMIETLYSAERIKELASDSSICNTDVVATSDVYNTEGVGVIEAPRGTLFHHFKVDSTGKVQNLNLIVATGNNNWAINASVKQVAQAYVKGNELTEGMLNRVEAAVRCYDPCLSCATHAMGQMPLVVDLVDADGHVVDSVSR